MALTGFNLPDIKESDLDSEKERRKILEYLYQLTEQLRFVLANLDEENLSDALVQTIDGAYTAASEVSRRLEDTNGNVSTLKHTAANLTVQMQNAQGDISTLEQTASGLETRVQNAEGDISTLTQTAQGLSTRVQNTEGDISSLEQTATSLSSRVQNAEGDISTLEQTASGLSTRVQNTEGDISTLEQTASGLETRVQNAEGDISSLEQKVDSFTLVVSNGEKSSVIKLMAGSAQIASQTIQFTGDVIFSSDLTDGYTAISGDNIKTGTILGIQLSGVYGSFDYLSAAGGAVYIGKDHINVNGVQIGYLPAYGDVCVLPNYHQYGNLGVGSLAWDQCVARYLYSASGTTGSYSMRKLKDNIRPYTGDVIDHLEPVRFVMKDDPEQKELIGFIADDVQLVLPEVVREFKDRSMSEAVLTLDYSKLVVPLVDEVKRLKARVATAENRTAELEARIVALEAKGA